ncbi:MAG TPA: hypothetical protein ACHBX0_13760 [Arsenophonus sp.]
MKMGTEASVSYDGAFADQYRAKEAFLIKLDNHVSMEVASLTGALSCTITGVDKLAITHTNIRASVISTEPIGMLYLWVPHQRGVDAFIVERNPYRYQFASKNLSPNSKIYHDFETAVEQEYDATNSQIDLCIDTSGQITELLLAHLAPGGKLLNVALKDKKATIDMLKITNKSLSIMVQLIH